MRDEDTSFIYPQRFAGGVLNEFLNEIFKPVWVVSLPYFYKLESRLFTEFPHASNQALMLPETFFAPKTVN